MPSASWLSGTYLGVGAIPPAWREKLENRAHIEGLAVRLAEVRGGYETRLT
jgi:hypothetical protein